MDNACAQMSETRARWAALEDWKAPRGGWQGACSPPCCLRYIGVAAGKRSGKPLQRPCGRLWKVELQDVISQLQKGPGSQSVGPLPPRSVRQPPIHRQLQEQQTEEERGWGTSEMLRGAPGLGTV